MIVKAPAGGSVPCALFWNGTEISIVVVGQHNRHVVEAVPFIQAVYASIVRAVKVFLIFTVRYVNFEGVLRFRIWVICDVIINYFSLVGNNLLEEINILLDATFERAVPFSAHAHCNRIFKGTVPLNPPLPEFIDCLRIFRIVPCVAGAIRFIFFLPFNAGAVACLMVGGAHAYPIGVGKYGVGKPE